MLGGAGARALLAAGLLLACFGNATVRAGLQIDRTFDKSEPWTIGYNSSLKGCVASARSNDGTTVWIGFDGSDPDIPAYVAFTNPNWRSIQPRKFYELEIQASGSHRWSGYGSGVERLKEKERERGLFVFGVKRRLLQELAQASGLVLSLNKEVLARTNISASTGVIEKLMSCQEHQIIASKNKGMEATRLVEEAENADFAGKERQAREQAGPERPEQQESEAAAREAGEKADREPAEREGVAREQPDEKEPAREPEQAAQHPAPAPAAVEQPPADPELKGAQSSGRSSRS